MTEKLAAEWAVVAFSMAVLAWVIYRLTGLVVRLSEEGRARRDESDPGA